MKSPSSLFLTAALTFAVVSGARAQNDANTIKFSDPAKPGTLKIVMAHGSMRIQGTDAAEVVVGSESKPVSRTPRKDGLRVLSSAASFSLTEKDNVITLDTSDGLWRGGGGNGDFRVSVPRNTSVVVQSAFGGDINCNGIAGDIEINSMNGEIRLDDVSGGIVVGTMNGEIRANIRELREGKPLSFTSMSGAVVIRVPESAKASVRLRTQNGSVLTDFDETVLVTKSESTPGMSRGPHRVSMVKGPNGKIIGAEVADAIREATREGVETARTDAEKARSEADKARREADRARRDADRERSRADHATPATEATPVPPVAPKPPTMPKIAMPPISGGKLVTGTLNGGGPEINVSTMNGDVTLRKLEAKK